MTKFKTVLAGIALAVLAGCASPNFVVGTMNNAVEHGDSVLIEGVDLTVSMSGSGNGKVQRIVIIGNPNLAARYTSALTTHGLAGEAIDGDMCALAGLTLGDAVS